MIGIRCIGEPHAREGAWQQNTRLDLKYDRADETDANADCTQVVQSRRAAMDGRIFIGQRARFRMAGRHDIEGGGINPTNEVNMAERRNHLNGQRKQCKPHGPTNPASDPIHRNMRQTLNTGRLDENLGKRQWPYFSMRPHSGLLPAPLPRMGAEIHLIQATRMRRIQQRLPKNRRDARFEQQRHALASRKPLRRSVLPQSCTQIDTFEDEPF